MLFPLKLVPGMYLNGTLLQAAGRWFTGTLIRFAEGSIRPLGGWQELTASAMTEPVAEYSDTFTAEGNPTALSAHTPTGPSPNAFTWDVGTFATCNEFSTYNVTAPTNVAVLPVSTWPTQSLTADIITGILPATKFAVDVVDTVLVDVRYSITGTFTIPSGMTVDGFVGFVFGADADGSGGYACTIGYFPSASRQRMTLWSRDASGVMTLVSQLSFASGLFTFDTPTPFTMSYDGTTLRDFFGNTYPLAITSPGHAALIGALSDDGSSDKLRIDAFEVSYGDRSDITLDGVPRSILGWRGNDGSSSIGIGTNTTWYAHWLGTLYDITPSGFTTGSVSAEVGTGGDSWGDGDWGDGVWGGLGPSQVTLDPPAVWHQDNWGDYLVGCCSPNDGELYYWDRNPSNVGIAMSGAPTGCQGLVVTPERFMVALSPGGAVRTVQWASQETLDDWTPTATNTAGNFVLEGKGSIVAARRGKDETLIWTTNELHSMRYIGGTLVYGFSRMGDGCGLIAPGAVAQPDTKSIWMGMRGFFLYDGYVQPVQSEVSDYVFADFNRTQAGKVTAYTRAQFGEVTWHYPSSASDENDRYITFNYRENHWVAGLLERTAGCDAGAVEYPVCGASNGKLYEHERGFVHLDTDGVTDLIPELEAGPVQLGDGDRILQVSQLIPDEKNPVGVSGVNLGNVELSLFTSFYPGENEVEHGPFDIRKLTDARFSGRWVRPKLTQVVEGDWRFGELRVDGSPAGRR